MTATDIILSKRGKPMTKSLDDMIELSKQLILSGFLPTYFKQPAQVVAVILAGREMGIPEMQALRQIYIIEGKPSIAPELMLALAYRDIPGFSHKIVKSDDKECQIRFSATGREPHVETFTIEQAQKMNLSNKFNWKTMPKTMLQWRCISAGLRIFAPDAVCGMAYTPEELGAEVDDGGSVIESEVKKPVHTMEEMREIFPPGPEEELAPGEIPVEDENQEEEHRKSRWSPENAKFLNVMKQLKKTVGDAIYYEIIGSYGYEHADEILDRKTQTLFYKELLTHVPESWRPEES